MNIKTLPILAGLLLAPWLANADLPGKHPYYLHALSDLRAARWMLVHRQGDAAVKGEEAVAGSEIDAAINEIKRAAIDDGKNIDDHPPVDASTDQPGLLHKALDVLRKVRSDVAREEDDPATRGLRDRAVVHIDGAIHAAERAIGDVKTGR
jgi:hypothetical protein